MKALTVRQPWAHAIIHSGKTVENRTRPTKHRGLLAIHAAKTIDKPALTDPRITTTPALADARLGEVVGTVRVIGCHHASECAKDTGGDPVVDFCSPWAEPDSYHWVLTAPQKHPISTPLVGRLGLFDVPKEIESDLRIYRAGQLCSEES